MATKLKRKSASSVSIRVNVDCLQVYPVIETRKEMSELKTVGVKLMAEAAIRLATAILAIAQNYDAVDLTAHRGRNLVSVTGAKSEAVF